MNQYSASKKPTLKIVLVILVLVLISGAGYGSWKLFSKSEYSPTPVTDWKVYTDKKYSFEIKYPPEWAFKQPSAYGYISFYDPEFVLETNWLKGGMVNILLISNTNRFALEDIVDKISKAEHVVARREINVGNIKAIEVESAGKDDEGEKIKKTVYFADRDLIYAIILLYPDGIKNQQYDQIFDHMISSFQFVQ